MSTPLSRATLLALLAWSALHTVPAAAQQVALGRLFATPVERDALDRQRAAGPAAAPATNDAAAAAQMQQIQQMQQSAPPPQPPVSPNGYGSPDPNVVPQAPPAAMQYAATPPTAAEPVPPPSSAVQLSGVLRGSSGRTTVWLNQVPQTEGAKAGPGPAVSLRLSSGRRLIMKPGQSFDPANGSVQEIGR
ncbi:hypothetical protein [Duganella vulcania]|uniref:Uncharacterized protein n=1 Tax=Duganella vulcania TaxID=2692166 RepID=A0A845GWY4_9BURK|nr:hypothetical protein [Duganella vulcania]MYM98794.1 hypothetical protein [Duganella vulcania]